MKHIRQIKSVNNPPYTVLITDNWELPLEEHPLIINHPEIYEIADCEIPLNRQYERYDN
jgi:hypothetical protein